MRQSVILSDRAFQTLSDAVKKAENKHEVGGVLLGHRCRNSYCIVDATVPTGEEKASYCSFEIDGERETEKANRIIDSYCIKPEPVGLWHSHITQIKTFSYQDRLTNLIFAKAYHDVVSLIVLPSACMDANLIISYSISPEGNEIHSDIDFDNKKIPVEYLLTTGSFDSLRRTNKMYPTLVRDLQNKLTSKEWNLVSHYIYKAEDYGNADRDREARECLLDAIAVARQNGEENAAGKVQYYLRFY